MKLGKRKHIININLQVLWRLNNDRTRYLTLSHGIDSLSLFVSTLSQASLLSVTLSLNEHWSSLWSFNNDRWCSHSMFVFLCNLFLSLFLSTVSLFLKTMQLLLSPSLFLLSHFSNALSPVWIEFEFLSSTSNFSQTIRTCIKCFVFRDLKCFVSYTY